MDRGGLVLHAVAVVQVAVLVGVDRLHRALPRPDLLVEDAPDHGRGMQPQVLADVRVREPGAPQQRRRLDRAAGRDDRARAHRHAVAVGGARLDAARGRPARPARARRGVLTRIRAPAACASASHVFTVDCFAPSRQP